MEQSEDLEQSISELTNNNISPTFPTPQAIPQYSIAKDKPRRQIRPSQKYGETDLVAYVLNVAEKIDFTEGLATYTEAANCSDCGKWLIATQKEMESLNKN